MGMATGQGPIPETEVNSGGGKRQNFEKSQYDKKGLRNYVFLCILCMKPLLPFPYTKEREKEIKKRYDLLSTGGKEKPPI